MSEEATFTQVLRDLLAARGPSGYETAPAAVWRTAAEAFGAQVSTDVARHALGTGACSARRRTGRPRR